MKKYRVTALGYAAEVGASRFGVAISRGLDVIAKRVTVDSKGRQELTVTVEVVADLGSGRRRPTG